MAFTPNNNPNLSPSRSVPTSNRGRRSSSHKVSIIPKDARRKYTSTSFSAREPSSPKVSCMGQVQSKKKIKAQKQKALQQLPTKESDYVYVPSSDQGPNPRGKEFVLEEKAPTTQIAPSLGTMKKFTSGRGSLSDFDVTLEER
ncbi:hypothetical protein RIF29_33444 [Crotalaria pallida]|uniref:Uncharacterized protein n=1 Tax=Crotalaria pallida TaxID=3830 RepID=A0AAN9HQQ0_CROPI